MDLASRLQAAGFRGELAAERPLAGFTTWRIGGPAECLAVPATAEDVRLAFAVAHDTGAPLRILGNGSNLLVADEGVRGIVLRVRRTLDEVREEGARRLVAGAGASFPALARAAAARGLAGLEFAGGIPGTVGGAVRMNAGWHEHEIGPRVESVLVADLEGTRRIGGADCGFAYRTSRFAEDRALVLEATLTLDAAPPAEIRERMRAYAESRKKNQPTDVPSCGSVFLKVPGDFAGRLIEAAGLKGLAVGGAEVSRLHANFIVNRESRASAHDVLALVETVERRVLDAHGVTLVREFELWK